jgi:hypothetical protein
VVAVRRANMIADLWRDLPPEEISCGELLGAQ